MTEYNYNSTEFKMRLYQEPFQQIKSGKKKIEIRLFDGKRKLLKINDTISFSFDNEEIIVKITDIKRYKDFYELYDIEKENIDCYY
jgi:ASC-1-like (ASCH) protein